LEESDHGELSYHPDICLKGLRKTAENFRVMADI
jgi:hypothetical protein